jgi:plastocyanin
MRALRLWEFGLGVLVCGGLLLGMASPSGATGQGGGSRAHQIIIPAEDRFTPYALTIGAGDTVQWVNQDTDDHTVVSDDVFTTAGHLQTDQLLPGTDSTGGTPSTFTLRFSQPGVFVYYCRFHAHLDPDHQPVAPGPEGGIQDENGNFGTPMTGLITVLPGNGD